MKSFSSSDLKTILHSKRANIYYLEYCRVLVNGGRVEYVTEQGKQSLYWNIPIANTTTLLLGTGTSITQAAMRELSKAGVCVGFCGGGGTPLYCGMDCDVDIAWLTPHSEYRPTEYLQGWVSFWFQDERRLAAAKMLQYARIEFTRRHWQKPKFRDGGFVIGTDNLNESLDQFRSDVEQAIDVMGLFAVEGRATKRLYAFATQAIKYGEFSRTKQGQSSDPANRFLDHGNYLAYGLGATATWVLGLPHGLSLLHGKTRRGGLVFDVADLIKDGLVLPQAFISAAQGDEEQTFRCACIDNFSKAEALDFMIDTLKDISTQMREINCVS